MKIQIDAIIVTPFEVNCYLCWDKESGNGVIIDPGGNESAILSLVRKHGFTPKGVLLTHGHGDHIGGVEKIRSHFGIPLYASMHELEMLADPQLNLSGSLGLPISIRTPEQLVVDDQVILIGSLRFQVLATPGHTPGGVCYLLEESGSLFCGDTLFQGSIGRTDLPGGSTELLLESIRSKILALPDSIVCYPGHGPRTTVGAERTSNPFLTGVYLA